ncbi:MAG: hypothetical protein SFV23_20765 [Planctomycetaceae bacterium]|nr:hypothetical protein [Planctomycetaceae bacterium]
MSVPWRFKTHLDLVVEFIHELSCFDDDIVKCGWFVEISRSRFDVYKPPNDKRIIDMLADAESLTMALDLVLGNELKGSYWDDAFMVLGI